MQDATDLSRSTRVQDATLDDVSIGLSVDTIPADDVSIALA